VRPVSIHVARSDLVVVPVTTGDDGLAGVARETASERGCNPIGKRTVTMI
jgi:hypothetical protein